MSDQIDRSSESERLNLLMSQSGNPTIKDMTDDEVAALIKTFRGIASPVAVSPKIKAEKVGVSDTVQTKYEIVVELSSNARSHVFEMDPNCKASASDEAAIEAFERFFRRKMSGDVCAVQLLKYVKGKIPECIVEKKPALISGGYVTHWQSCSPNPPNIA